MGYKANFIEALRKASYIFEDYSKVCEVISVDLNTMTCDVSPKDQSPDILFVSLYPLADSNAINTNVNIPKIGSNVIVSFLSEDRAFCSMFSEVESIYSTATKNIYYVGEEITLNGNNFEGLVKVKELTDKLNNLENTVNSFIAKYNLHTHPYVNVATPAVTSATSTLQTDVLTPTLKTEIQNNTVKHGDKNKN